MAARGGRVVHGDARQRPAKAMDVMNQLDSGSRAILESRAKRERNIPRSAMRQEGRRTRTGRKMGLMRAAPTIPSREQRACDPWSCDRPWLVRHQERRAARAESLIPLLTRVRALRVQVGGGLVEENETGRAQKKPGKRHALRLSHRQSLPSFSDHGLHARGRRGRNSSTEARRAPPNRSASRCVRSAEA